MTRSRAGNNMTRSRAGILGGAATAITKYGTRKTTMGDIAREGGVAKATLYNHFRAKSEVYAALLEAEVESLLTDVLAAGSPGGSAESLVEMAAVAATRLGSHPVVKHLAASEPEVLAALVRPSKTVLWRRVVSGTTERVSLAIASGALHAQREPKAVAESLLRWVLSHAAWPAKPDAVRAAAYDVVHGLLAPPLAAPLEATEPPPPQAVDVTDPRPVALDAAG
jgi:AcrR family transcriptional regulator